MVRKTAIEQTFNGSAGFGKRVTCQISRNGDLIHRVYLQVALPALSGGAQWAKYAGLRMIKNVEIEIGGQRINLSVQKSIRPFQSCAMEWKKNFSGAQHFMPQMLVWRLLRVIGKQHCQIAGTP